MKKLFVILGLVLPSIIFGQDCCWYSSKITTKIDSLTITEQKIKIIRVYEQRIETDSLPTKKLLKTIDVFNCISEWCDTLLSVDYKKDRIVELFQFNYLAGWGHKKEIGKYKLIHSLDKEGRITKTQRKWIKGGYIEDFDSITYEYKGNLLIKANYFSGMEEIFGLEKDEPYKMLFYEYE